MAFLTEPEPTRSVVQQLLPGIGRIVAANPGPMTYHGTNTYLIDTPDGLALLDPGPDSEEHVQDILAAVGDRLKLILVSHTHHDHIGALPALQKATGAPTAGYKDSAEPGFTPDIKLEDRWVISGLTAIHTPGHAADHICLAMTAQDGTKVLFSADHVMSWSSSIVSPPFGDMAKYFDSLKLLLDRDDEIFLPGAARPRARPAAPPRSTRSRLGGRTGQRQVRHPRFDERAVFAGRSPPAKSRRAQRAGASSEAGNRRPRRARGGDLAGRLIRPQGPVGIVSKAPMPSGTCTQSSLLRQ
jgi:glyoxylase-like metal-dependent hydrolase (beta-lactamase superfamily II)